MKYYTSASLHFGPTNETYWTPISGIMISAGMKIISTKCFMWRYLEWPLDVSTLKMSMCDKLIKKICEVYFGACGL